MPLVTETSQNFRLWWFFLICLMCYRVLFLFLFRGELAKDILFAQSVIAFINSVWFDAIIASFFTLVPFVISFFVLWFRISSAAYILRKVMGMVFIPALIVLGGINIGFYTEYQEPLNAFLFQFFNNDPVAILATVWSDFNVPVYILVFFLLGGGITFFLNCFVLRDTGNKEHFHRMPTALRLLPFCFLSVILLFSLGVAFGNSKPGSMMTNVTGNSLINKSIFNPFLHFRSAVMDYTIVTKSSGLGYFLPDCDIQSAAKRIFTSSSGDSLNLDNYYVKRAKGMTASRPDQIFLIIGESLDIWPFMEKYRTIGAMSKLSALADSGLFFENFVPASSNTMFSLGVIITGLPDCGKPINYHIASHCTFPTSIAPIFHALGYQTRFYYGGYGTWQRIQEFCYDQGFDAVYTQRAESMADNAWGIDDRKLFDQVLETISPEKPSLNIILTTNNHKPYRPLKDFQSAGFPLQAFQIKLQPFADETLDIQMVAHRWYMDRCIDEFVEKTRKRFPHALFVITGDHYGRRFINARPTFFERSAVPLIMYGEWTKTCSLNPSKIAGSHLDIAPTLIEMVAPEGFEYHLMGQSLFAPGRKEIGFCRDIVITPEYICDIKNMTVNPLPGESAPVTTPDINSIKKLHDSLHALSWWRLEYGPTIKSNKKSGSILKR